MPGGTQGTHVGVPEPILLFQNSFVMQTSKKKADTPSEIHHVWNKHAGHFDLLSKEIGDPHSKISGGRVRKLVAGTYPLARWQAWRGAPLSLCLPIFPKQRRHVKVGVLTCLL